MPYKKEFARSDSLGRLVESPSVKEFMGVIRFSDDTAKEHRLPSQLSSKRGANVIKRVIAIDGSTVTDKVRNGYPGAEAALLNLAAIVIKLQELRNIPRDYIPGPNEIRDMERCQTLSAVLPGCNVVRNDISNDSPKRFFRETINKELDARLDPTHETLRETLSAITKNRSGSQIKCPVEDCERQINPPNNDFSDCGCLRTECIYATDALRIHERFEENGSNEEAFTAVRQVIEHLTLVNILRYFERTDSISVFRDTAFIIDGPLALFGMSAWLKHHIQKEIERLHCKVIEQGDPGILVMGIEKSGHFLEHLSELDWSEKRGPRHRLPDGVAFVPNIDYIHRHIMLRPPDAKPYGMATYYGRKILYKTKSGQHTVVMTPIINDMGRDPKCISEEAYPRISDALDIMDELASHLYQDAFTPLVRVHAHAAIPLRMGTRILSEIFRDK